MREKILEICRGQCGREIAEDEELIRSRILGSFQLLELIVQLEEEFGVNLTPEDIGDLGHFRTVCDIEKLIMGKIV